MAFIPNYVSFVMPDDLAPTESLEIRGLSSLNISIMGDTGGFVIENAEGETQTWSDREFGFITPQNSFLDYIKITCLSGTIRVNYFTDQRGKQIP